MKEVREGGEREPKEMAQLVKCSLHSLKTSVQIPRTHIKEAAHGGMHLQPHRGDRDKKVTRAGWPASLANQGACLKT